MGSSLKARHVIAFLFVVAIGYGGYYIYAKYVQFEAGIVADRARAQEVAANHAEITQALVSAGVPALQVGRGFWYTYTDASGDQSVAYFDPDQWSLKDLSASDISNLAALVASSSIADRDSMHAVAEADLPPELQFHNTLYTTPVNTPGQYQSTQEELQSLYQKGTATSEQLWELSYMYELQGDYATRDAINAVNCQKYAQRCTGSIPVTLAGSVVDSAGRPVQGATVTVLSHPELAGATTDAKGSYQIHLSVSAMEKLRVSAVKRNYSSGVASTVVLSAGKSSYQMDPITLASPIAIVTIDTDKHTVTDPKDTANADGSFVLLATSSRYEIPAEAIRHADGTPYHGPLDVYIYEFTRETVPASLTSLDTFDTVLGYAGNLMQTLGMPFIQFFSPTGEQLDVFESDPMLLTFKISGMQDMLSNYYQRPEGPLTEDQLQTILAASSGDPGFPITTQWLYDHHISTFSAFWVFDHVKGTWKNEGMRLLDAQGTMQAPFYTRD